MGPETRTALWVLMTATGMVLLIGCANLANLALACGVSREREVAVRHLLARDGGACGLPTGLTLVDVCAASLLPQPKV